ncbi:MAG: hypothetical protein IJP11_04520 [Oscillospiraceae bacterium]|nr:hypothetical protein [Oscillospiraceae bacterium]
MKKIIAILLAAMMLLSLLTACGSKNDTPSQLPEEAPEVPETPDVPAEDPTIDQPAAMPEDPTMDQPAEMPEMPEMPDVTPDVPTEEPALDEGLLNIVTGIYGITAPEFPVMEIPVDMNDSDALFYYTGLTDASLITGAVVSEAAMGSQAYSLVLVRAADASKVAEIAEMMEQNIDTRKWICVEADDVRCVAAGDIVMFIMVDSEYASVITADGVVDAFVQASGLDLDIE